MAGGAHIYRPPTRTSRYKPLASFCVRIVTSGASASVLPVSHRLKLVVGFFDASAAELATTGLTDDLVSVQPVPLDLHVAVALADIIAPTPCSDAPPVQPVLKTWLLCA